MPDGRRIITGGSGKDNTVRIWETESGRLKRTVIQDGGVHAIAIAPVRQCIVTSNNDNNLLQIWHLAGDRLRRTLEVRIEGVNALAVTPDGQRIITGSDDHTLGIWDLASGNLERTIEGHTGSVEAVAVTPDGQHIITGSDDHTLRVWDLVNGTELARWVTDTTAISCCAAATRDRSILVVYGDTVGHVVVLEPELVKVGGTSGS